MLSASSGIFEDFQNVYSKESSVFNPNIFLAHRFYHSLSREKCPTVGKNCGHSENGATADYICKQLMEAFILNDRASK